MHGGNIAGLGSNSGEISVDTCGSCLDRVVAMGVSSGNDPMKRSGTAIHGAGNCVNLEDQDLNPNNINIILICRKHES
jgi:hypothetical protein